MPSAFIVKMLAPGYETKFRSQGEMKAIFVPSGDHFGWQAPSGIFVRCTRPVPSTFISQISTAPERVEAKAIWAEPPNGVGRGVRVIVGVGLGGNVAVGMGVVVLVGEGEMLGSGVCVPVLMNGASVPVGAEKVAVLVGLNPGNIYPIACRAVSGLSA